MCGVVVVIGGLLGFGGNGVGLVFYCGLLCFIYFYFFVVLMVGEGGVDGLFFFFFLGVDGRLWVASGGGGGVRCVLCSSGGDCGS